MKAVLIFWIRLFYLSILTTSVWACSDDINDTIINEGEIDILPGMNVVGRITDGANPIEGVVVSDGYSVVDTDKNGIYQMRASRKANFVYISIPADCEIPVDENGCPLHYQSIELQTNKVLRKDFSLKKIEVQKNFRLLAFADVQIDTEAHIVRLEKEIPSIVNYVEQLKDQPIYGISLGDLGWDNMDIYSTYKKYIGQLNIPFFSVIGNHDHNENIIDQDMNADYEFKEAFGPTYYSYNIGNCHFVVLDDVLYKNRKKYDATITNDQFKWLKKDLSYVDKNKLIIIAVHIPIERRNSNNALTNKDDLYKILDGFNNVRILSGHSHNNYTTNHLNAPHIEENTLGAISGSLWYKDTSICNDGSPSGYAIYEIEDNKIKNWYYKGIHTSKDYQIQLYKPGSDISGRYPNDVLINIFTWHDNWKRVELYEDGKWIKSLTSNVKIMDPMAYSALDGDLDRIEKNNDHMFRYTPSNEWSTIEIKTEDAYGNKYESKIKNDL